MSKIDTTADAIRALCETICTDYAPEALGEQATFAYVANEIAEHAVRLEADRDAAEQRAERLRQTVMEYRGFFAIGGAMASQNTRRLCRIAEKYLHPGDLDDESDTKSQRDQAVTMYALALDGNVDWDTLDYTIDAVEVVRQEFVDPEAWQRVRVEAVLTPEMEED